MQTFKTLSPGDVSQLCHESDALLVDVRTPAEHSQNRLAHKHLPIPLQVLESGNIQSLGIDPAKPVILLCQSGGRAKKAADLLSRSGVQNIFVVEGGLNACQKIGLACVQNPASHTISLERQVRIAAGSFVFLGAILSFFVNPFYFIVPAAIGGGLVFAGLTDWCGLGLLLARAPWNQR